MRGLYFYYDFCCRQDGLFFFDKAVDGQVVDFFES